MDEQRNRDYNYRNDRRKQSQNIYRGNRRYNCSKPPESTNLNREREPINFDRTTAKQEPKRFLVGQKDILKPIKKFFYNEDPKIAELTEAQVEEIRNDKHNIRCRRAFEDVNNQYGDFKVPNPVLTFEQAFRDYPEILNEIRKQSFQEPSPIQCQAWPILMTGKDMIGIAQTGTGKTLAFLLPGLIHIDGQGTREGQIIPNVLVLAPTRELAQQINSEVNKYEYRGIKATCIYGGGNRGSQIRSVENGVHIIIATPGRLIDLIKCKNLDVSEISYLVLDEADRMLDMGFEPQIRKILNAVRADRQTIMTSATWPEGVKKLAESYMMDPIQVIVGSLNLAAVHTVKQKVSIVDPCEKKQYLQDFLRRMGEHDKTIVFFKKKSIVNSIAKELTSLGLNVQSIHSSKSQTNRERALNDLKTGAVKILLATDIASRGIDIEDVTHVFNYDFPRDIEEYVHRVGRTGRAGRTGVSISLLTRGKWDISKELISILQETNQAVPLELIQLSEQYEVYKEHRVHEKDVRTKAYESGHRRGKRGGGGGRRGRGSKKGRRGGGGGKGRKGDGSGGGGKGRKGGGSGGGRGRRNDNARYFTLT